MELSIVIVNWNTARLLRACLSSVFENAPTSTYEVIVVDNASDDNSCTMVKREFPEITLIESDENLGFARANNLGFTHANGRHILLLNPDTEVIGNVLQKSLNYLIKYPHVGAMGCKVLNSDQSRQPSFKRFPSLFNISLQSLGLNRLGGGFFGRYEMAHAKGRYNREVEILSGCYLMVTRRCLSAVGGLDTSFFLFGEETDWCMRARAHGYHLHYAPVGSIIHHGGGSARRLNHRRDMMLSEATIRLHEKHRGLQSAYAMYWLLFFFNGIRAIAWKIAAWGKDRHSYAAKRAEHFTNIINNFKAVWPYFKREV